MKSSQCLGKRTSDQNQRESARALQDPENEKCTMSVISSLLRLTSDTVAQVNHWSLWSRVGTHRFVTLPATSGGELAAVDFGTFREGTREDVS
jgi:hypothetical protein